MQTDRGRVIQRQQNTVTVQLATQESCAACSLARLCTGGKGHDSIVTATAPSDILIGDNVELVIDDSVFLKASAVMYGIPLAAFLTGVFAGYGLALSLRLGTGWSSGFSIVFGFALVVPSVILSRYLSGRLNLVGKVTQKLDQEVLRHT